MGSLRGNRGRSRADPLRILALSCLFALHNIETTLRSVVPPAAGLHTYTWCTTSAQNPLSLSLSFSFLFSFSLYLGLSSSLLLLFPGPTFTSSFNARTSCILPRVPFSSLTTIFTFARRKRDRWMNRRRAQGSETSRRRTPATGFGGQTGDRESRESRPTIHFYPVLLFSPRCWIWRESKHSRFGRAVNYPRKRRKLKANRRNVR